MADKLTRPLMVPPQVRDRQLLDVKVGGSGSSSAAGGVPGGRSSAPDSGSGSGKTEVKAGGSGSGKTEVKAVVPSWKEVLRVTPIEDLAREYRNKQRVETSGLHPWRELIGHPQPVPRLEYAKDTNVANPNQYVFHAPVAEVGASWCELDGSVYLQLKRVETRFGHVKKGDLITGCMVPCSDGRNDCRWFCIHVLRVNTGLRLLAEEEAQRAAAKAKDLSHLAASAAASVLDEDDEDGRGRSRSDGGGGSGAVAVAVAAAESVLFDDEEEVGVAGGRCSACHGGGGAGASSSADAPTAPWPSEVDVPALMVERAQRRADDSIERRERGRSHDVVATAEEIAAGLVVGKTLEDGKIRFEGVVTSLLDEDGAVVSRTIYLHRQYVRSAWGAVALGDFIAGLMVPAPRGGCAWRCIHVTTVDRGGRKREQLMAADREATARELQEHEDRQRRLAQEDHKSELEKLKAQMAAKREAEQEAEKERRKKRVREREEQLSAKRRS